MGHLVNPISLKLGVVNFWDSQFATLHTSYDYKYIVGADYFLYKFIRGFFLLTLHMLYNYGRRKIGIGKRHDGTYKHFIVNTMKHYISHRFVLGNLKVMRSMSGRKVLFIYFFDGYCESFVHQYFTSLTVSTYLKNQFLEVYKYLVYKGIIYSYFFDLFYILYLYIKKKSKVDKSVFFKSILIKSVKNMLFIYNKKKFSFVVKKRKHGKSSFDRFNMFVLSMLTFALGFFNLDLLTSKGRYLRRFFMSYTFNFKFFLRRYFYYKRVHHYRRISRVIWFYLSCFYDRYTILEIYWRQMHITSINSGIMGRYIASRLIQRFRLGETVWPVLNDVKSRDDLLGCHIKCSGRFSRRDMAVHKNFRLEKKPMNSFRGRLEFFHETVFLKNSAVSIKLWLSKKMVLASSDKFYEKEAVFGYSTNAYLITSNSSLNVEYFYKRRFETKKMPKKKIDSLPLKLKQYIRFVRGKKKVIKRFFNPIENFYFRQKCIKNRICNYRAFVFERVFDISLFTDFLVYERSLFKFLSHLEIKKELRHYIIK